MTDLIETMARAMCANLTPRQDEMLRAAADRIEALTAALLVIAHAPIPPHLGPAHELTNVAKRALEAK